MRLFRWYYLILLPLVIAVTFLIVSRANSKENQCKKIIDITVELSDQIKDFRQTQEHQEALQAANFIEEAAQEMESLVLEDEQLQEYQAGLVKIYRGSSQYTRDFIAELEKKNLPAANSVKTKLKTEVGNEEEKLVEEINSYCQEN